VAQVSLRAAAQVPVYSVLLKPDRPVLVPRFAIWAAFIGLLLVGAGVLVGLAPLPPLDQTAEFTLCVLAAATLAAEVFTVDFPDRKRISGGYIFPLLASVVVHPAAGVLVAGAAGIAAGLLRGQRLRSALFHGPQLALAAAAAAGLAQTMFDGLRLDLSLVGAAVVLVYMATYTTVAWGLGRAEEMIAAKPAEYAATDGLTNLLLVPLPLALGLVYDRTSVNGLLLSSLALALLLIVVRAYVNLATLHGELEQTYTRLSEQERRLEGALETNREMSQVVSHDLRGPLTSVMGYTELLRSSLAKPQADSIKQLRYVESIEGNSRRILNLADKLLDLHRIEEGAEIERTSFDAAAMVRHLAEDVRVQAERRAISLELDVAADLPSLYSSEWMVREIAENLLSNAIKYSRDGGRVTVRLRPLSEELLLEVEDNGIGMSSEDQARLFTKFFRGGSEEVRGVRGTGLGLALTRTMIGRLEGSVEVWSELGQGSRFSVRLPLGTAE
jgi:signal transduction histidine kinase